MKWRKTLLFLTGVILAACQSPQYDTAKIKSVEPESQVSETTTPLEGMIIYKRSGGFSGKAEQWTIYSNGMVTSSKGDAFQLSPGEVNSLLTEIEASGFFELEDAYGRFPLCPDCTLSEITVSMGNKTKTIVSSSGAIKPEELTLVLEKVIDLLDRVQGK
ncbi:MAG: hypothetical protein PHS96_08815 [Anaerolineales bacterium]|nr:hypothetical protein [Anaerolineales bacterium]